VNGGADAAGAQLQQQQQTTKQPNKQTTNDRMGRIDRMKDIRAPGE
jgi:hypothetical protein